MLGIIVTGHGQFAAGLCHANEMIAGNLPHVQKVLFEDGMNLNDYSQTLNNAIRTAVESYSGAIVLTDLKGGTPFNTAMLSSAEFDNVAILSGTNLPMLIEGGLLSQFSESAVELAQKLVEVGRTGVDYPSLNNINVQTDEDDEEGI